MVRETLRRERGRCFDEYERKLVLLFSWSIRPNAAVANIATIDSGFLFGSVNEMDF